MKYTKEQEQQAHKEYLATLEVLTSEKTSWTGDWEKDKKKYIKEWLKIQEILNDDKWNVINNEDDYI